ncbi:hypothetical protein K432DRAFT_325240, partial [Lepidopterella palustris CBS 459.81]
MAPIRRYLRITKHSVLEVRIYLDRPSDSEAWLLRRDNPALPRVIEAVRPLVLPKLREENERARGRGSAKARKKGVKDVVVGVLPTDDFDVSIFLTESSSRHSLLTKQKDFLDKPRMQSNSGKLTSWLTSGTSEQPVVVPKDGVPIVIREDAEDAIDLDDIPEASGDDEAPDGSIRERLPRRSKRTRHDTEEGIFVQESSDSSDKLSPPMKRGRRGKEKVTEGSAGEDEAGGLDDKKKLGIKTSYEGFSIYGLAVYLVVKRKGARFTTGASEAPASGQQMLENWVSTQAAAEQGDDGED